MSLTDYSRIQKGNIENGQLPYLNWSISVIIYVLTIKKENILS